MNKTKLGISNYMCDGIIFILAAITTFYSGQTIFAWPFIALIAFVLLKEDDLWLKASVLKAVLVILFFILIPFLLGFVDNILSFVNFFVRIAGAEAISDGWNIIGFFNNIVYVVEKIFLLLLALFAFKGKTIKIPVVDGIIRKHLAN